MGFISYNEAKNALFTTLAERKAEGSLSAASEDGFWGSCDRWSMVIEQLSRYAGKDGCHVLDIGAWEGMLLGALQKLGYRASAIDWHNHLEASLWKKWGIDWHQGNIEADPLPFPDNHFTGIYMGQILEHFTYSPRKPMAEVLRVLKDGGILVVDVPNVGELHNYYRLIRGKNVLYDYKIHYIDDEPIFYKGLPYFNRHNHEFTPTDLRNLCDACGFKVVRIAYIRSRSHGKKGLRRLEIPFSAMRDLIPIFRKTLMLTAQK